VPKDLQTSLAGGELSPALHSHADLAKYRSGLALCKNWFVHAQGGVSTRAGFEYIAETIDSTSLSRLIDFQFNTQQTYALIFTDLKMRVIRNGGQVLEVGKNIVSTASLNPFKIGSTGHGYSTGDDVYVSELIGPGEANNRFFRITVLDADNFTLDGVDGLSFDAYVSDGQVSRVFTLTTPYLKADLFRLKYTQSADVMTITHPAYKQRELSRLDHDDWNLSVIDFAAGISPPDSGFVISALGGGAGSSAKDYRYVITSIASDGAESIASDIQAISTASLSTTHHVKLVWNAVVDCEYYNVYKEHSVGSGIFGFVGEADNAVSPTYKDYNFGPDMSVTPPTANNPFDSTNNYPSCVNYEQQRIVYGATHTNPQTVWMSKTSDFDNMDRSRPTRDDDAIERTLASRQVNEIRHFVVLDDLIVLTSGGAFKATGDQDGVMTPSNTNFRPQGYRGCSHVRPLIIGESALYVQEKGSRIRDLSYAFETDRYSGNDLTILARHLFEDHEIVDWCNADEPYGIIWAVREDGVLLSLSYLKEHQVFAWSRHETDGLVESVTSISENNEDIVYAIIKRTINGADVRYVERMHERNFEVIDDAFCVDSGLTYDGTPTSTLTNLHHLEGENVVGLADGNVVDDLTVVNGSITLPHEASKIHIGLPYECDIKSLEISFQDQVVQSRKKQVANITIRVLESRGLKFGKNSENLYETKERTSSMGYGSVDAITGQIQSVLSPGWTDQGQVFIRQSYPLPATVLAIIPEIVING